MNWFLLPCIYGVSLYDFDNEISCMVDRSGNFIINEKKVSFKRNLYKISFLRGVFYFFTISLLLIKGLFEFSKVYSKSDIKSLSKAKRSLNVSSESIVSFVIVCFSIVASIFIIGVLPLKLSFLILPNSSIFVKKIIMALIKVAFLYLVFLTIKLLPGISQYYKFNSAIKVENTKFNALLLILFQIFFCMFNISLFGLASSVWYFFIINLLITLLFLSIGCEFFLLVQNNSYLKFIIFPINFLIYENPSPKEIRCVKIILSEKEFSSSKRKIMSGSTTNENMISLSEAYVTAKDILDKAGKFEKSDLDFIFCEILNKNRAEYKLIKEITKTDFKKILKIVAKRAQGEPISKIFGHASFYGLDFHVTKDVLSPRMDTERLVEEALKFCNKKTKVLDIGTGSGAIAIAIAKNSSCRVTAVDISDEALSIARKNAENNNVRVDFKKSDLFSSLKKERFDIIISNPPYIPSKDVTNLDEEVRLYDPIIALDGGEDGLDFYRKIIVEAPSRLNKNGKIFLEIGIGQAKEVKNLLQKNFKDIKIVKDYNKIERVVIGTLNWMGDLC